MGSSRLPNKVIFPLAGKPLLVRMYERVKASPITGTVVVATTTNAEDDLIVKLCKKENIPVMRGHPTNLLDRHYKAGLIFNADIVIKIPSDCPLIAPDVITRVIKYYIDNENDFDYVSNLHPATYPDGNDIEVMSFDALRIAWMEAKKDFEREHTTPYIWENDHLFRIGNVAWESGMDYSMTHRWTIDYEEDYTFINAVYDELYPKNHLFGLYEILNLLEEKEYIKIYNNKYAGVNWYRHHLNELKTIENWQTKII
jgi:spore coat polysaccharide biosynthesis protein SpsF